MAKRTIKFRNLSGGLRLAGDAGDAPRGVMRRNRGIHPISENIFETRDGSSQLFSVNAVHSLTYFEDIWHLAASTLLYRGAIQIKSGLSGSRLSFTRMPPTSTSEDYLFCAGGGELFKVSENVHIGTTDLITNGSMETDANWASYGTPAANVQSATQVFEQDWSRKFTPNASDEGIQSDTFTTVTNLQYRVSAQVYPDDATSVRIAIRKGDNSGWAYDITHTGLTQDAWNEIEFVYTETAGGAGAYIVFDSDTASSGDWYIDEVSAIRAYYASAWGIDVPQNTLKSVDGGSGGELTSDAVYKYRCTFYNERTNVRGNASDVVNLAGEEVFIPVLDAATKLLCHAEGADASTTLTDSSEGGHTSTAVGNAQIDTAQYKFGGAASALFDGTGDYFTFPRHSDWSFGSQPFTIELWFRPNTWSSGDVHGLCGQRKNADRWWAFRLTHDGTTASMRFKTKTPGDKGIIQVTFSPALISAGTWVHLSVVRGWAGKSKMWSININGTSVGTKKIESSEISNYDSVLYVGAALNHDGLEAYANGWIDELRISKGAARWIADFTPETTPYEPRVETNVGLGSSSTSIDLTQIPQSSDPQVTHTELWRTIADGTAFFHLTRVPAGTTTYTDDVADAELGFEELPVDNIKPYPWFDDCFGPYNASMFWITRTESGERGRLYYSPIGRPEAMEGFIEVATDDAPLQKGVTWTGAIFVVGEDGWYQIYGTNPYFSRKVTGAPGTTKPHTVIVTPAGVIYEAKDGVRVFNGTASTLIATKADVGRLFRGKRGGALTSFDGVVADFGRGEYFISDETQLIAFNVEQRGWRDVGDLEAESIHYAKDADIVGIGTNADGVYDLEKEGTTQDNSNDIERDIETDLVRIADDKTEIVLHVHVDYARESLT